MEEERRQGRRKDRERDGEKGRKEKSGIENVVQGVQMKTLASPRQLVK